MTRLGDSPHPNAAQGYEGGSKNASSAFFFEVLFITFRDLSGYMKPVLSII
jgi:hypothetical protein